MRKFISGVQAFIADENGVTAIEYGLIAALIGAGLVVTLGTLKTDLVGLFNAIGTKIVANTPA